MIVMQVGLIAMLSYGTHLLYKNAEVLCGVCRVWRPPRHNCGYCSYCIKKWEFFWHNILPESWIIKRYKSWSISPKYSNVHLYLENKLIFSHKYILTFINNYYLSSKNCKTSCILLAEIYHYHILRNVLWNNLFMNHLVLRAKFVGLDCLEVLSK